MLFYPNAYSSIKVLVTRRDRQCQEEESFPSQSFLKGFGETFVHKSFPRSLFVIIL